MDKSFNGRPYFFLKISNKICLLSSYLDNYDDFFNQPLKQRLTGRKRGEDENTKT